MKLIQKKEFKYSGEVIDLCVSNSHTYNVEGLAVHNSGAGSMVNYVLGITNLDPIKYGLIFERFISPSRKDEPDIDNDVADRDLLINRMKEKFGEQNVVPITNFNTLQLKSLVKDISRLYNVPFEEVNDVTSHLDAEVRPQANNTGENKSLFQLKFDDCIKYSERFRNFIEKYPQVGKHINVLYKQQKSLGRHAGGVIVVEDPEKYMPLITVRGEVQTPWAEGMHIKNCSPYGLIKFDILGLETLRMIQRCIELILKSEGNENPTFDQVKKWYDEHLAPGKIDEKDQKVFEHVFAKKRFAGIFQFTAKHTQRFIHDFDPTSVDDLAVATAIYRPGPLAAKADKLYIKRKRGEETLKADHPAIEKVLGPTYMLPVFQEQIMSLAHELAGMSLDDCDRLRKAILKRSVTGMSKNKSETELLEEMFIEGAVKNGYEKEKAQKLYDDVRAFSSYAFNKSHSVAYAFCSYQTAWLMTYYEPQWLCSYIESMIGDPDSRAQAISEIKSLGYKIGKVDINKSSYTWEVNPKDKTFFPSFRTVKGVGDAAIEEILRFRPYKKVEDLFWRIDGVWKHSKFNKKALENLIRIGAFDSMEIVGPSAMFSNYRQMCMAVVENMDKLKKKDGKEFLYNVVKQNAYEEDWTIVEKIENHKEIIGDLDVKLIVSQELQDYLQDKGAASLETIENGEHVAWFILTKYQQKLTKNKKPYLLLFALDSTGKEHRIFAWGAPTNALPDVNSAYISPIEKNEFGYSLRYYRMKKMELT